MTVSMSFVNMKRSPALEQYAIQKIQPKIEKMAKDQLAAEICFIQDHGQHIVRLNLRGRNHLKMVIKQKATCMAESIDLLSRRLGNLLSRIKGRERAGYRKIISLYEEPLPAEIDD